MDDLHCMRREGERNKKKIAESGTAFPGPGTGVTTTVTHPYRSDCHADTESKV